MSGHKGKVVAAHADRCRVDSWLRLHRLILCTRRSEGAAHEGVPGEECDELLRFTVSDAIVRSWLCSTAARSSPLGYFSRLLQVVDK